jgi:hypothetical protein
VVDPFAESHDLEENSNPQMIKAVAAWRRIARVTRCAILLLHHVRKGVASDMDAARGAKAVTDSARVGLLLATMSEAEADEFGISHEDRFAYVRLDDAKSNMSRRAAVARWYELETVELHNCTETYPSGDRVAAVTRWLPPSAFGDLTVQQCNEALDAIERGVRDGVRYGPRRSGGTKRWVGQVLVNMFDVTEKRAGPIISTWLKNGVIEVRIYEDKETRKPREGIFVVDARRPGLNV